MRTITLLSIMSILLAAGGCVPSLHSIVTEETQTYDPDLAGKYKVDGNIWTFVADAKSRSYALQIEEDEGKTSKLTAKLANIAGQLFLELYAEEVEGGDWVKLHLIPVHTFWKFEKTETGFTLAAINPDTMTKLLEEQPKLIKHEVVDRIVLTDSTENLQKFLTKGLAIEEFYGEPQKLIRITD